MRRTIAPGRPCAVLFAAILMVTGSCGVSEYRLGGDDAAGVTDGGAANDGGGGGDSGAGQPDAAVVDAHLGPDGCIPHPETCNHADDDCDGIEDDGFHLDQDPNNCGDCGNACDQPNTAGSCSDSLCHYHCLPGYVDSDGDPSNGCDYFCTPTNGGVEACDFTDNDCDQAIDEGLDLDTDVDNCGACGHRCLVLHAEPTCSAGLCGHGVCDPGYADVVDAIPGCEYQCPQDPPAAESCDNIDNDCDAITDELPIAGLGADCTDPGFEANGETGTCSYGVLACSFGTPVCVDYVRPTAELCDELDNDCDGHTDESFDQQHDPHHCGGCSPCVLDNAVPGCSAGACTIVACQSGFVDADGDPDNGCEYGCTPTGPEVCDGVDNDCDHDVDLADADLTAPANFCATAGACAGTAPTCGPDPCGGAVSWRCTYPTAAETTSCGAILLQETICDDTDGDCDGRVDESFGLKGTACTDDLLGACQGQGAYVCSPTGDAVTCEITDPGAAAAPESCNGADDDCDGLLDEGAPDDMVPVSSGGTTFWIYAYEASRPDATAAGFGDAAHRACSRPGVLPWHNVTWTEAAAACTAAGRRLCTEAEWQLACAGAAGLHYPYGNSYQANACNGRDYDPGCTAPDDDEVLPAGTSYGCPAPTQSLCVSPIGAFDLSGNLREWTATEVSPGAFRVRGGAYDNVAQGLTCDLAFIALADDFYFPNLGFRCCSDTTP